MKRILFVGPLAECEAHIATLISLGVERNLIKRCEVGITARELAAEVNKADANKIVCINIPSGTMDAYYKHLQKSTPVMPSMYLLASAPPLPLNQKKKGVRHFETIDCPRKLFKPHQQTAAA